jgi:S1-C subfamily serine protease
MRALFFSICVVLGLSAGSWWTLSDRKIDTSLQIAANTDPETEISRSPASVSTANSNAEPIAANSPTDPETTGLTAKDDPKLDPSATQAPAAAPPDFSYFDGIMRVAPSVVSVYARELEEIGNTDVRNRSQGSGVIVDADGVILTNLHIVNGLDDITVVLSDGRVFAGLLIGSDIETDLAVVRIPATGLPYLELNEAPPAKVGDIVLAIGNPFGVGQTVTQGIVSATRRRLANGSLWQNFIQIDAAINPGNSGGALINPHGQLVGVNTAVFRSDRGAIGIGFSIPAELLAQVVPQIIENGSVARGWLGIDVEDLRMFPALQARVSQGVVITGVQLRGPADVAGVKTRDIVTRLGEQSINSADQLLLAVSSLPPEATVKLELMRGPDVQAFRASGQDGEFEQHVYKITLGTRPHVPAIPQVQ